MLYAALEHYMSLLKKINGLVWSGSLKK
jgi:hypothetical protein